MGRQDAVFRVYATNDLTFVWLAGMVGSRAIATGSGTAVALVSRVAKAIRAGLAGFVCALVGASPLDAGAQRLLGSPSTFFARDVVDRLGGTGT